MSALPPLRPRPSGDAAPLTCAQRWWWDLFPGLKQRRPRSVQVALRVTTSLHVPVLRDSLEAIIQRHEALRTRITAPSGSPLQLIDASAQFDLEVIDVTSATAADAEAQAQRLTQALFAEKVELSSGPLFAARLVRLGACDYVLVLALHHLIADSFSSALLCRDLWSIYAHHAYGVSLSLPPVRVQPADYALWQQATAEQWRVLHEPYWRARLDDAPKAHSPVSSRVVAPDDAAPAMLRIGFARALTRELRDLSRRQRTFLSITVLTLYIAALFRWREASDLVIVLVASGRHRPELANTVGFLASLLYLRVTFSHDDTFSSLLKKVTQEYYTAHEHFDEGRVSALYPRLRRRLSFNWRARTPELHRAAGGLHHRPQTTSESIQLTPFLVERPVHRAQAGAGQGAQDPSIWDAEEKKWEPMAQFTERAEQISGSIEYRYDLYSRETMERLASLFRALARHVVKDPQLRLATFEP